MKRNTIALLVLLLSACASAPAPGDPCTPLHNDPDAGRSSSFPAGALPPPADRSPLARARDCEREHAPVAPTSDQNIS